MSVCNLCGMSGMEPDGCSMSRCPARKTDTVNTHRFCAANARSPVIAGRALEEDPRKPARGAAYTLADGQTFTLNVEECRAVTPRWAHD